jgi:circadian clock protein KaiC
MTLLFHGVANADVVRGYVYGITTLFKNAGCTAMLHTDPPAGSGLISRFGVEESIMDGVIVLRLTRERGQRRRTIEVYKMRGVNHGNGENPMKITSRGIHVFPRMEEVPE